MKNLGKIYCVVFFDRDDKSFVWGDNGSETLSLDDAAIELFRQRRNARNNQHNNQQSYTFFLGKIELVDIDVKIEEKPKYE